MFGSLFVGVVFAGQHLLVGDEDLAPWRKPRRCGCELYFWCAAFYHSRLLHFWCHVPLLNFVSVVALRITTRVAKNGPLYPACLLNFEIRK